MCSLVYLASMVELGTPYMKEVEEAQKGELHGNVAVLVSDSFALFFHLCNVSTSEKLPSLHPPLMYKKMPLTRIN